MQKSPNGSEPKNVKSCCKICTYSLNDNKAYITLADVQILESWVRVLLGAWHNSPADFGLKI
jgi:hypothetical protein